MSTTQTKTDIVQTFMNALEANNREQAASYLSESFIFSGWTPQPLNKQSFLNVIGGLKAGLPNLTFNLQNVQEQDTIVTGTIQVSGHQTDSFILPELSLPPIPQMGESVSLPTENVTYAFNEHKQITQWNIQQVPEGDIYGLIRQLGIDVRPIQ
ncbi:MAG TPA: hypothetical protein VFB12_06625 [Ktedonobacteraceae bacterium]|nr:hypothetical protein [Ktedonobacteraceae bacterium]